MSALLIPRKVLIYLYCHCRICSYCEKFCLLLWVTDECWLYVYRTILNIFDAAKFAVYLCLSCYVSTCYYWRKIITLRKNRSLFLESRRIFLRDFVPEKYINYGLKDDLREKLFFYSADLETIYCPPAFEGLNL